MVRSDFLTEVRRWFVNPRERRLRSGWRITVAAVAVAVVAVGVFSLATSTIGGQILWNTLATAVLVPVAWLIDRRVIADLGLGGSGWWRNLGFGLLLGVVMTTVVFGLELAAGLITVSGTFVTESTFGLTAPSFWPALAATLAMFLAVGVGEEVVFRGYLFTNLAEGLNGLGPIGPRAAIGVSAVATSAIFGVVHLGNPNATLVSAFNITAVGVFFAATYVATDDLGIPIGIHITWNFSLSAVYGFPVSGISAPATLVDVRQTGDPLVTGGRFGPEAGLVVYVALAVAAVLTWWWVRRYQGELDFRTDVAVPELRGPDRERSD